jgi:hypothetical protein
LVLPQSSKHEARQTEPLISRHLEFQKRLVLQVVGEFTTQVMVFRRDAIENCYADPGMYNAESDFAFA